MWIERGSLLPHLVVQHGEGGEALQDAKLKEIEEDPHHGHFRAAAFCTQTHEEFCYLVHLSKYRKKYSCFLPDVKFEVFGSGSHV